MAGDLQECFVFSWEPSARLEVLVVSLFVRTCLIAKKFRALAAYSRKAVK